MTGPSQLLPATTLNARAYLFLWAIFDAVGLIVAWQLARSACLVFVPAAERMPARAEFLGLRLGASILLAWIGIGLWLKYYTPFGRRITMLSRSLEMVVVVSGLLVLAMPSLYRGFPLDLLRSFVVLFTPLSLISLAVAQYVAWAISARGALGWQPTPRIGVIGRAADAAQVVELIGSGGYRNEVAGVILPEREPEPTYTKSVRLLATTRDLAEVVNREHLARLIIIDGALPDAEEDHCCRIARRMGVMISRTMPPSIPDTRLGFSIVSGLYLLDFRPRSFTKKQELVKRMFDVIGSLILIAITSPILLVTAILVKATSPGPLVYTSYRVGRGGRYFRFYKFRSMFHGGIDRNSLAAQNEQTGHLFKIRNDPRITPVGRFIRRYSIDELPQLFNVLAGDMSLVGPRPLPSEDMEGDGMSRQYAEWSEMRARALPGISGLWQVQGRAEAGFEGMMSLDMEYIRSWSLKLDLIILMKTPKAILSAKGAC